MAAHGARRLLAMAENAANVIGIELLAAAQGCDFHAPLHVERAARARARAAARTRAAARRRPLPRTRHRGGRRSRALRRARRRGRRRRCPRHRRTECMTRAWLTVTRGDAPLLLSLPAYRHRASRPSARPRLVSSPLARHDADWHIDRLYAFATELGATTVHTALSRTVIDVNRDPSGASLYPGQTTTGLVPDRRPSTASRSTATAQAPTPDEIERRKRALFRALPRRARRGDRAAARPASARRALRLPLHPLA